MNKQNGSFPEYAEMSLESHLTKDPPNSIANHFPKFCNLNNYREVIERYFIEIGLTEMLDHSLARISAKLGFELLADELQTLNSTDRGTDIPDNLKARFIESHQFDYTIYNYIRSGFHPQ